MFFDAILNLYCWRLPVIISMPMETPTLGNMRQNGIRSVIVRCSNVACRHEAIVNVDKQPDGVFVPSLGPRMRCERCGQRGADVRPNWYKSR